MVTRAIEERFDAYRFTLKGRLGLLDPFEILPYRGHGTSRELFLRGRVLEEAGITHVGRDDAMWKNVLNMARRFASDEVAGARLKASFEGLQVETTADAGWGEGTVDGAGTRAARGPFRCDQRPRRYGSAFQRDQRAEDGLDRATQQRPHAVTVRGRCRLLQGLARGRRRPRLQSDLLCVQQSVEHLRHARRLPLRARRPPRTAVSQGLEPYRSREAQRLQARSDPAPSWHLRGPTVRFDRGLGGGGPGDLLADRA